MEQWVCCAVLTAAFLVMVVPVACLESSPAVYCDVAVLGGSTASLAAAITAAESNASITVCFTEITDWPGGQLTSAGVSAIDFGPWNYYPPNLARSFSSLVNFTSAAHAGCWVSYDCFLPSTLVEGWIMPTLAALPNLRLFLRSVVISTTRDRSSDGLLTSVTVVSRMPTNPSSEWDNPLSETLEDWYSPENSTAFTKQVFELHAEVFIDATEFADVLVTSGAPFTQGAEYPHENSHESDASCGLAATLVFFMELSEHAVNVSLVPAGSDAGIRFPYKEWATQEQWNMSWTYRRGLCNGSQGMSAVNVGDVTQQNWINDVDDAYYFVPMTWNGTWGAARNSSWRGGVNLTAQKMLEDRAYGTFRFLLNTTHLFQGHLGLSLAATGTNTGLSKMPYLRDTRRAVGIDGYRFSYASEDYYNASYPYTGEQLYDVVALGDYLYADMHKLTICELPEYQWKNETKPYYIPFRALTVMNAPNLLVAGKTMAQTFHANAATRLHPSEWASGAAAGAAAVLMCERGWSTSDVLEHVHDLQQRLASAGLPLKWSPPGPLPPLQIGYSCIPELNRCVGATNHTHQLYPTAKCNATCPGLLPNEWLIHGSDWIRVSGNSSNSAVTMKSNYPTEVTKSLAAAITLPAHEKMSVCGGTICEIVASKFDDGQLNPLQHSVCLFRK